MRTFDGNLNTLHMCTTPTSIRRNKNCTKRTLKDHLTNQKKSHDVARKNKFYITHTIH